VEALTIDVFIPIAKNKYLIIYNDLNTTSSLLLAIGENIFTNNVYKTEYDNFATGKLELEVVAFLYKGMISISPAIEKNVGKYDATNWKLGIPVSLKDKEGKPTLNFELQWREINTQHSIGISVGYNFGKFVQ